MNSDDAAWVISCAITIMTMQSGFALLESGNVSSKNAANIMVKNVLDVLLGGLSYFCVGFGFAFGEPYNSILGFGNFFLLRNEGQDRGSLHVKYLFQFAFVSTTTTIVSGACCERIKLPAYILFSLMFPIVMGIPTSWIWRSDGWLNKLGFHDFSGACPIHFAGGCASLVALTMLGPRLGRFSKNSKALDMMSTNAVTTLTGTFILWWAWLAFTAGSTFGITGDGWKQASLSTLNTLNGSIGGAATGILWSLLRSKGKIVDIGILIDSLLGGLVSISGSAGVITPMEAFIIGIIGAMLATGGRHLFHHLHLDDPVGVLPVHFVCGLWSTVSVGLFGHNIGFASVSLKYVGLFHNGGFVFLGVQVLGSLIIFAWSTFWTYLIFIILRHTLGLRVSILEEVLGADRLKHRIKPINEDMKLVRLFRLHLNNGAGGKVNADVRTELEQTSSMTTKVTASLPHFDVKDADISKEMYPNHLERSVLNGAVERAVTNSLLICHANTDMVYRRIPLKRKSVSNRCTTLPQYPNTVPSNFHAY